jgi:hypothetical protein
MSDRGSSWTGGVQKGLRAHAGASAPAGSGAQIVNLDEYRLRRALAAPVPRSQPLMWHEMVE